jgi:hypothetical protein
LGIAYNLEATKILYEEFTTGSHNMMPRTQAEKDILNQLYEDLNKSYGSNYTQYFGKTAGQRCSDMLVQVGEMHTALMNVH